MSCGPDAQPSIWLCHPVNWILKMINMVDLVFRYLTDGVFRYFKCCPRVNGRSETVVYTVFHTWIQGSVGLYLEIHIW